MRHSDEKYCSGFFERLDRTAEKSALLWLPCMLIFLLAKAFLFISGAARRGERSDENGKTPALRIAAVLTAAAVAGMYLPVFSDIAAVTSYAEEGAAEIYHLYYNDLFRVFRDGAELSYGAEIREGDVLSIKPFAGVGYDRNVSWDILVNGTIIDTVDYYSQRSVLYTVGTRDVYIEASGASLSGAVLSVPQYAEVRLYSRDTYDFSHVLGNGDEVFAGDRIRVSSALPSGYRLDYLRVNGRDISDGGEYSIDETAAAAGTVNITIGYSAVSSGTYHLRFPSGLYVSVNNNAASSGDEIRTGDIIRIFENAASDSRPSLVRLYVNGTEVSPEEMRGAGYIVKNEDVTVTAEFNTYKISIPGYVSVKYSGTYGVGGTVYNGSTVYHGDALVIKAEEREGFRLKSLTVNGTEIADGSTYYVGYEDVDIRVSYEKISGSCRLYILSGSIMVFRGGVQLENGSEVSKGDVLTLSASALPTDGTVLVLKINGAEAARFGSGVSTYYYSVSENDDVYVSAEIDSTGFYTLTFPAYVSVKRYRPDTGDTVKCVSGDRIAEGDELTVRAEYRDGYTLDSLTVNGTEIRDGDKYTVKNSDVVIKVSYTQLANTDHVIYIRSGDVKVTRDGKQLETGDAVKRGDVIRIDLITPDSQSAERRVLKINGIQAAVLGRDAFTYYYTVGDIDPEITTSDAGTSPQEDDRTLTAVYNVYASVKRYDYDTDTFNEIPSGARIYPGDILKIAYSVNEGYHLTGLRLNGVNIDPGYEYTVGSESVVVTADVYKDGRDSVSLSFPSDVRVTCGGSTLYDGMYVNPGDIIYISAPERTGYRAVLKVNGVTAENGSYYEIGNGDVVITLTYVLRDSGSENGVTPRGEIGGQEENNNVTPGGEIGRQEENNTVIPGGESGGREENNVTPGGGNGGREENNVTPGGGNGGREENNNVTPGGESGGNVTDYPGVGIRYPAGEGNFNPNPNPVSPAPVNPAPAAPAGIKYPSGGEESGAVSVSPDSAVSGGVKYPGGNPDAAVPPVGQAHPDGGAVHVNPDPSIIPFIIITGGFNPDDISADAGAADNPVSDTALPVTNGVGMPARLPGIPCGREKKRYRIIRRRKLKNTIFVY